MPNTDLSIRFTEEQYATKQDVARALGTSTIDPLWQNILAYRNQFRREIPLPTIDKQTFHFILTPSLLESLHRCERKMLKLMSLFAKHQQLTSLWMEQKAWLFPLFQPLATKYGASTADRNFLHMLEKRDTVWDVELEHVNRYVKALDFLATKRTAPLNEEWIHAMLTLFYGTDNLPSFYREKELTNRPKSLVARVYEAAPYPLIESLMQALMQFVVQSSHSSLIHAIITYFYMDYIKPFEVFNDELSLLAFKNVLVHQGWEALGCYLPMERIVEKPEFSLRALEVQKTHDLTYLLTYCLPLITEHVDMMLDTLVNMDVQAIAQEQRGVSLQEDVVPPSIPSPISASLHHEIDANQLTTSLLETHPSMRRNEAYFYARHREAGKFYTIAQFKTLMGCAYETARTSMEHLVNLGYYRKEQYKNKFVYTPVDIKGA